MNDTARTWVAIMAMIAAVIFAAGGIYLIVNDASGGGGAVHFQISETKATISTGTAGGFLCAVAGLIVVFVVWRALKPPQPRISYEKSQGMFGSSKIKVVGDFFEGEFSIEGTDKPQRQVGIPGASPRPEPPRRSLFGRRKLG